MKLFRRSLIIWSALTLTQAAIARVWADESPTYIWEGKLQGDAIVLLGEVHDNAEQHLLRLEVLKRAFAAGWRPAIAMEQFDREHQADIDQARAERPQDADYLIEKATAGPGKASSGWNWDFYRPYVVLALEYHVPIVAANLSSIDATAVFEGGYPAVFDSAQIRDLGLGHENARVLRAQKVEIDRGHCHAFPTKELPSMARAQLARDAVMARVLREHAYQGIVLLAGDGHVRRDIGVATWFDPSLRLRLFTVGFLEEGDDPALSSAFDAVVITKAASRPDPCAQLRRTPR